jgi:hypothetical protein
LTVAPQLHITFAENDALPPLIWHVVNHNTIVNLTMVGPLLVSLDDDNKKKASAGSYS